MPFAVAVVTAVHTVRDVTHINMSRAAASCTAMIKLPCRQVTLRRDIDVQSATSKTRCDSAAGQYGER